MRPNSLAGALIITLSSPGLILVSRTAQAEDGKPIRNALKKLAEGDADWKTFSLTYDDLHGLHGGLTLTISGTGKVEQNAVRRKLGTKKDVSKAELKALVVLLQKHSAWVQKEPARKARPDESKARLTIKYEKDSVTVWEWFNDLAKNKRLLEIREGMKKAAWKGKK